MGHRLRCSLYRQITDLSWGNVDRLETSDLLVRLTTDVNQVRVVTTSSVTTLTCTGLPSSVSLSIFVPAVRTSTLVSTIFEVTSGCCCVGFTVATTSTRVPGST